MDLTLNSLRATLGAVVLAEVSYSITSICQYLIRYGEDYAHPPVKS